MTHYRTISSAAEGIYKEKGSKFQAYASPLSSSDKVQTVLAKLRKQHPKARHYCYAYRLGLDGNDYRANDDREPNNSAGKPILNAIDSATLTNILLVVVRYFGGTKLGIPGLQRAYRSAAEDALQKASIVKRKLRDEYLLRFDFDILGKVMDHVKRSKAEIITQDLSGPCTLRVSIPSSLANKFLQSLQKLPNLQVEPPLQ